MKVKKSSLKEFIKRVVRQTLSERAYKKLLREVSPPGAKAERMIKHVKASLRDAHPDWDEDKITNVAIATAWKAHSDNTLKEYSAMFQEVAPKGWEGTVKAMKKEPGIENPWALAHWMKGKGYKSHKDEQVGADVVAGESQGGMSIDHDYQDENEKMRHMDEFGLTSEKKEKWIKGALDPEHKGYCTPMTKKTCTPRRKALAKRFKKGLEEAVDDTTRLSRVIDFVTQKKGDKSPERVADLVAKVYKHQYGKNIDPVTVRAALKEASYKVAPKTSAEVQKDDHARRVQTEPTVTEASYKVVPKTSAEVQKDDHARRVQTEPDVTEHKVQHRSYYTVKDQASDPQNRWDPTVPPA